MPAASQEPGADNQQAKLSIADCIAIAISRNYSLKQANESLIQAEIEYYNRINEKLLMGLGGRMAVGGDPMESSVHDFSATGNISYQAPSGDTIKAELTNSQNFLFPFLGHGVGAEYRHPLAKGQGRIVAWQDVRTAERAWTVESVNFFLSKQEISSAVIKAYFRLILAQKIIEVNEIFVANSKDNLEITKKKFNEGLVPKIDLSRSEVNLLESEIALLNSQKSWNDIKDSLMTFLAMDPRTSIEPVYDIPYSPVSLEEASCIEIALAERKELKIDETNIAKVKDDLEIAKNNKKPQIDFVAKWNSSRIGPSSDIISNPEYLSNWSTMIEYSMDINRKRLDTDISQAKRGIALADEKIADSKRTIVKDVRDSIRAIKLAESRVINKEENMKAAEERLHLAKRSWEEGIANNREMIDAQQALVQAQSALVESKIDYIIAEYDLNKAMGYDLAELVIKLSKTTETQPVNEDTTPPSERSNTEQQL